jgi:hypothetical protein
VNGKRTFGDAFALSFAIKVGVDMASEAIGVASLITSRFRRMNAIMEGIGLIGMAIDAFFNGYGACRDILLG